MTGTDINIWEELHTSSQSDSEVTSSSDHYRTTTPSQSEIFSDYNVSSEASSREISRPSSPESGNLTAKTVYLPLPEMAILHQTMHDAIHTVREQQGRAVTRKFLQQQQVAANKLQSMTQIRKTSTPDAPPPKSNAFPRQARASS